MKQYAILFVLLMSSTAFAGLPLKTGSQWILAKDLTLTKTGLTPEEFVPYTSIWDLKSNSFLKSIVSNDSCELRTAVSKKIMKQPSFKVKKASKFSLTNIQETTMSIMIDIVSVDPKKAGVDQIQITCSAYEQGLDSFELKQQFKQRLSVSLAQIFTNK